MGGGSSQYEIENDMKIVKCVVGLEVLFRIKEHKQEGFINSVNELFWSYTKEKENLREKTLRIYRLRSSIVHQGKRNITNNDAELTERIASGCMLKAFEMLDNFPFE